MIIDVDTHWEATAYEPGHHPLEGFQDRLPAPLDRLAFALAGDLLAGLPDARRPAAATLIPHLAGGGVDDKGPPTIHPRHNSTSAERAQRFFDSTSRSTASATAQPSGLPPKVVP